MTCPGCDRDGVALIGGYCGHCTTTISRAVGDALDEISGVVDGDVVEVYRHEDGKLHVTIDDT